MKLATQSMSALIAGAIIALMLSIGSASACLRGGDHQAYGRYDVFLGLSNENMYPRTMRTEWAVRQTYERDPYEAATTVVDIRCGDHRIDKVTYIRLVRERMRGTKSGVAIRSSVAKLIRYGHLLPRKHGFPTVAGNLKIGHKMHLYSVGDLRPGQPCMVVRSNIPAEVSGDIVLRLIPGAPAKRAWEATQCAIVFQHGFATIQARPVNK